jgi:hypothetical protein
MSESKRIRVLNERIEALERENKRLKSEERSNDNHHTALSRHCDQTLSNHQIERYGRQLLLSNGFGVSGQKKLLESSALIIGAGGIGSTGMQEILIINIPI